MSPGPMIFDQGLLRDRWRRVQRLGASDFLLAHAAAEVGERVAAVVRRFECAVDLGTANGAVRRTLAAAGNVGAVIAVHPLVSARADARPAVAADQELLPFGDGTLDLVISALSLQFANDLPGALVQIRRALKPDGLFLAVLIGGETLAELRQAFAEAESDVEGGASPRVAPFADLRDLGALLQRVGFALPVADAERLTVRYASPLALMHDLRRMGAANALVERRRRPLRRTTLARMMEIYGDRFSDPDGRVRATFELIWLSGWAPDASQQQPLRPGSARQRLADALGTQEAPAGEKAAP